MKYRSQWPTNILRSNFRSYWLIISKYDVYTSNSLQDIRQNHSTMKYRSQWCTFVLRSNNGLYWLIIPKHDVLPSNSFQDIRQNHWTMKYRSQWPKFILRSNIRSYWLLIPKNDVIYRTVFKIQGKITGPWNTGYSDLHLISISKSLMFIQQIVFKI